MDFESTPMRVLQDLMFDLGWRQVTPASTIAILPPLIVEGPMSREQLDAILREDPHSAEGLASSAWEPLHEWTDEELAALDAKFEDIPLDPASAAEVIAEEAAEREAALAQMSRFFDHFGLPVDHSIGGLVDLLVECRVLLLDDGLLSVNTDAPLPGEVLPLSQDEAKSIDQLTWARHYEGLAQEIIAQFDTARQETNSLQTSIDALSALLSRHSESVRSALELLIQEGDFSADVDVQVVDEQTLFTLVVDWDHFNRSRISIRMHGAEDDHGA